MKKVVEIKTYTNLTGKEILILVLECGHNVLMKKYKFRNHLNKVPARKKCWCEAKEQANEQ